MLNPQGVFHAYGSHAGGAGPVVIIAQTRIPQTKIPNDIGNEVEIRDITVTAARASQDSRVVVEIADDNGSGAPGTFVERAVVRVADYGNAMRSYSVGIKIKQNQWFRVRFTQGTPGAIEVELTGYCAAQDLVV